MVTRKVDFRRLLAPQWCLFALALSGTTAAHGQAGGAAAPEQQLFPKGLPKFEVMLKATLEHHPEVLAARSKLRAAEAEQRQAELKAIKEVMAARERWGRVNHAVAATKDATNIDPEYLREVLANQAAIEWELAFLLGLRGESAEAASVPSAPGPAAIAAPVAVGSVIPRGELADGMKTALKQRISASFDDTPLADVAEYLSDRSGLRFVLDKATLEGDGVTGDLPITCQFGELELASLLQALEDLQKPLYFVVRDYGILVTTESQRSSKTVSACDFAKLTEEELKEKLQQQRQDEARPGGGIGGGGGGMF